MLKKMLNVWFMIMLALSTAAAPAMAADGTAVTAAVNAATEITVAPEDKGTALDALIRNVGAANIEVEDTKYGKSIKRIKNSVKQDPYYWAFYINGIFAPVNYDAYNVKQGDKLTFVLEDWNVDPKQTASVKIIGADGKEIIPPVNKTAFLGSPTAFQLLQVLVGADKIGFQQYDFGKMITSINGVKAEGSQYWGFYVNGKMASTGADSYKLQPGDELSFKLEGAAAPVEKPVEEVKTPGASVSKAAVQKSLDAVTSYVLKNNVGEWEVIALKKAGKPIPSTYLSKVKKIVKDKGGKFSKITDAERYALGLAAAGGNPQNTEGYKLISQVYNGQVAKQGLNGVAYGLIVLDSANYSIPKNAKWTKQKLTAELLAKQNSDGGWSWDGSKTSDIDTTSMVLTALAPHKAEAGVKAKVDAAVKFLSSKYMAGKIDNSSSAAQTVIALSSLNLDAHAPQFTKNGVSLISYLLTFQNSDGGFDWQGGEKSDVFSTAQAIQAVVAYQLKINGKGSLYSLPLSQVKSEAKKPVAPVKTASENVVKNPAGENNTVEKIQEGHRLPDTATNGSNFLVVGAFLLAAGLIYRRKTTKTE